MLAAVLLLLARQFQIPQPVGYVNDFAGVVRPALQERMLALIDEVRARKC